MKRERERFSKLKQLTLSIYVYPRIKIDYKKVIDWSISDGPKGQRTIDQKNINRLSRIGKDSADLSS